MRGKGLDGMDMDPKVTRWERVADRLQLLRYELLGAPLRIHRLLRPPIVFAGEPPVERWVTGDGSERSGAALQLVLDALDRPYPPAYVLARVRYQNRRLRFLYRPPVLNEAISTLHVTGHFVTSEPLRVPRALAIVGGLWVESEGEQAEPLRVGPG